MTTVPACPKELTEAILVRCYGTDEQLERYRAGVLPEQEFLDIAYEVIFRTLGECDPFTRLSQYDVWHRDECNSGSEIAFKAVPVSDPVFSAEEWVRIQRVRRAVGYIENSEVDVIGRAVWCRRCGAERRVLSARVTVKWSGRELVRNYRIT